MLTPAEMEHGNAIMRAERHVNRKELLHMVAGCRVVDIGAGSGYYTASAVKYASHVTAIEPSRRLFDHLSARFSSSDSVSVLRCRAEKLSRDAVGVHDVALLALVIDHLSGHRLSATLRACYSILRARGRIVMTDVSSRFSRTRQPFALFARHGKPAVRIRVSPHSIDDVCEALWRAGFRDTVVRVWAPSHHETVRMGLPPKCEGIPLIMKYVAQSG